MSKPSCVVYLTDNKTYADAALKIIQKAFTVCSESKEVDYLFSFLNPTILKHDVLRTVKKMSINIHPSLPEYQGVCGVSRALYDGKTEYGITAHLIDEKVDCGKILKVIRFPIYNDTCETLNIKAKNFSLILLEEVINDIVAGKTEWNCNEQWSDNRMTRKQFQQWITLQPDIDKEELEKIIKAVWHPRFPGPFIELHGYRFSLTNLPYDSWK